MKKLLILLSTVTALLFTGCSNKEHAPLATVEKVNLERYLGTWYEIARYDQFFERGCSNITATYSLKEDKTLKILNRCTKEGELSEATGKAYADDETNSKLKVSFFGPFYGDYWIIMLDEEYSYAVIGTPSREYFWILSRTPKMEKETLDSILEKLPSLGYDKSKLIYPVQDGKP
ncbi:MAG: Outer membrane lipoprotein Blc [uncultured Sulfurovum sp.]|uniref:Outer membrane lipoprotein Blc n=1 Tax=uncultured Sulfurovum sp. TaxID=269237 RepID=A0A6S6TJK2_9BACT|nr:MAG: Outer membrane lipoprotein Blc [uncultured Sulfurovum sp.]